MSTDGQNAATLLQVPPDPVPPASSLIVSVARDSGISPFRQFAEMSKLHFGPGKLNSDEYYSFRLYDPSKSIDEKKEYVGTNASRALNLRMSEKTRAGMEHIVDHKLIYGTFINAMGLRSTHTQAYASSIRSLGNLPVLSSPETLEAYLREKAKFPLFGKPQFSSMSVGSILITGLEGDTLILGNGKAIPISAFCAEVFLKFSDGYLLQDALLPHPDLASVVGNVTGTVRMVTIRRSTQPELLYSLWKVPSPAAMSDNFWQSGSMIARVDRDTGQVGTCWAGKSTEAHEIEEHPVSQVKFADITMPDWEDAKKTVLDAHAMFPEFGVLGWDVALTDNGPTIVEGNTSPLHTLYQLAYQRGVMNPEFKPVFDQVEAYSEQLQRPVEKKRKRNGSRR